MREFFFQAGVLVHIYNDGSVLVSHSGTEMGQGLYTKIIQVALGAFHYDDVIIGAIAYQITSLTIVYTTVYSDADQRKTSKFRVTGLCVGNSPGTDEFPAQMASNAEMFPFDDIIMSKSLRARKPRGS